jgi:parallel beta-helix repeat protein
MRILRIASAGITAALLVAGSLALAPLSAQATPRQSSAAAADGSHGRPYGGDPSKESALVSAENQRIYNLRAITAAARWSGIVVSQPYVVKMGATPTLVLVAADQPYTLSAVETLIPSGLVRQPDGSYLLSDNLVVESGATLSFSDPDGATLHLASSASGFVSIISQGGALALAGSQKAPLVIDSWDASRGATDTTTADGRSYVRIIGGTADFSYVTFENLGFWSGNTGGVAVTGTQSNPSAVAQAASKAGAPPSKTVHGATLAPTGSVSGIAGAVAGSQGTYSYATAELDHVIVKGDAYGLFVNGSKGVDVENTVVENSLVDGIVLHRYVTNSTITSTVTKDNAVDGFAMTRASTGIDLTRLTSTGNGRDGISLDDSALADGPNATGTAVTSYGGNTVTDSTSSHNGRYGISVIGGNNIQITGNTADDDFMGIVLSDSAKDVAVRGNEIDNSTKHGISLIDFVSGSSIRENSISGADIGVYLRDSSGSIQRNTVSGVTSHAVSLIGSNTGSVIAGNTVSGSGPTAIDTARGSGATVDANTQLQWTSTKPLLTVIREVLQPLTVMWVVLGLIVLLTAFSGRRHRKRGIRDPYENLRPLSQLTKGIVTPEEVGLVPAAAGSAGPVEPAALAGQGMRKHAVSVRAI